MTQFLNSAIYMLEAQKLVYKEKFHSIYILEAQRLVYKEKFHYQRDL